MRAYSARPRMKDTMSAASPGVADLTSVTAMPHYDCGWQVARGPLLRREDAQVLEAAAGGQRLGLGPRVPEIAARNRVERLAGARGVGYATFGSGGRRRAWSRQRVQLAAQ